MKDFVTMIIRLGVLTAIITAVWMGYIYRDTVIGTYESVLASLPHFSEEPAPQAVAKAATTAGTATSDKAEGKADPAPMVDAAPEQATPVAVAPTTVASKEVLPADPVAVAEPVTDAPRVETPVAKVTAEPVVPPKSPQPELATGKMTAETPVVVDSETTEKIDFSMDTLDIDTLNQRHDPVATLPASGLPEGHVEDSEVAIVEEVQVPESLADDQAVAPELSAHDFSVVESIPVPTEPVADLPQPRSQPGPETMTSATRSPWAAPVHTLAPARRAAWLRQYDESLELYRRKLAEDPDNVDAWGEMGNVLLSMQKNEEAARAFYQAALKLAQAGNLYYARQLSATVRRLDPQLADNLDAAINDLPNPARAAPAITQ